MASIRASGSDIGSFASVFRSAISSMSRGIGDRVHCGGLVGCGTRASAAFGRWPMAVKDAAAQMTPIRAKLNCIAVVVGEDLLITQNMVHITPLCNSCELSRRVVRVWACSVLVQFLCQLPLIWAQWLSFLRYFVADE